jgi:hypothetical protein
MCPGTERAPRRLPKEADEMAMLRIAPMEVRVRCDWFDGSPRTIRLADSTVPVVKVERIRDESRGYPVSIGPRTIFEVRTPETRLALTYHHRRRRWVIEGIDPELARLGRVA